jgi:hypothetical protein
VTRDELRAAVLAAAAYHSAGGTSGYLLDGSQVEAVMAAADAWAAAARAGERERVAGLLDEASAAVRQKGIALFGGGGEEEGRSCFTTAAGLASAASLVRGKVPEDAADLLPGAGT